MSDRARESPATEAGRTRPAGEGVDDREMTDEVARQTSPDLAVEPVFEREAGGTATDKPVEQETGDDLRD